jgi:hypothetical protein
MNGFYEANPKLHRALTQIQSNIQVNENLVNQLEKTETEYSQMRNKFEKKIYDLHEEISSLRQMQNKNNILAQTKNPSQKEKKHMNEVRLAYENKMKVLMNQLSDLRRKYSQTSSTIQSSRNQNESTLKALRVSVESLKVEKRHMVKKMKDEAERVKEKLHSREREIQQLNRKQIKDNEARRRLEREGKRLEIIVQKKTDESIVTGEKLKRLVTILKKAVREGGVLNEKLLASCGSILDIGNVLVQTSNVNRLSRKRKTVKKNKLPVDIRADKKKHLLDQALSQFIQGKQAVEEMKQLLAKRNTLTQKKAEFISEREMLLADQDKDRETIDQAFTQVIDDNIESVEAEISYLNARIHAIHNDAANEIMQDDETDEIVDMSARQEKRVTFVDDVAAKSGNITQVDDEWLDMDSLEEKYSLSPSSGPEQCIDVIDRLLKSISPDESKFITEFIVDDLLLLRMEDSQNKKTFQQLEQTAQNLRCTLFVMKKAAIETTIENEKKIKKLQGSRRTSLSFKNSSPQSSHLEDGSDADSAIDLYSEEQYQHVETKFDKIYNDGISGNLVNASWEEYQFSRPTSPIMDTLPSPHLKPQLSQVLNGKSSVTGPLKPSASPLTNRRNSMTSPEQFLLHLLHTSKDARPPPPPSPLVKPAEFARYQAERESSTSSIRNRNPRRSSIQSDNFSLSSVSSINQQSHKMTRASSGSKVPINYTAETNQAMVNNTPLAPMLNRRRAFSFQQPTSPTPTPTNLRRRSLLREISNGIEVPKSPLQQQYFGNDINEDNKISRSYSNGTSLIPAFNNSMLLSSASHQTRPYSVLSLHSGPKPTKATAYPIKKEHSASNSYEMRRTPSTNNVFDRLSSGHTHASQAKKRRNNYRHSSSSIDDLRKKWSGEMENIV